MNLEEIKELISVMRTNKIKEIDLEQEGTKIRIVAITPASARKGESRSGPAPQYVVAHPGIMTAPPAAAANGAPPPVPAPVVPAEESAQRVEKPERAGKEIKSPMVGTFYRAPAPGAPPYVEVGATIGEDTVICIVEAMKLMNEIKAEMRGRIVEVLVENGQPVEFNQPLFLVEPI
ncbi:acetyl-CoA carboxylase biotin carboxyl carrier protein [Candidatus Sumerlaeota bacterium]|nr:acetyl-CoA carboxylase biotin carboxyl carrier protein [Candidatus Sumerlaeota bacterium]